MPKKSVSRRTRQNPLLIAQARIVELERLNLMLVDENARLRTEHDYAIKAAERWEPIEVRVGCQIVSMEHDFRLTHALVEPGRDLYQVERNTHSTERATRIDYTRFRGGRCIVLAASGKILTLIYPEDLEYLRSFITEPMLKLINTSLPAARDLFTSPSYQTLERNGL